MQRHRQADKLAALEAEGALVQGDDICRDGDAEAMAAADLVEALAAPAKGRHLFIAEAGAIVGNGDLGEVARRARRYLDRRLRPFSGIFEKHAQQFNQVILVDIDVELRGLQRPLQRWPGRSLYMQRATVIVPASGFAMTTSASAHRRLEGQV